MTRPLYLERRRPELSRITPRRQLGARLSLLLGAKQDAGGRGARDQELELPGVVEPAAPVGATRLAG